MAMDRPDDQGDQGDQDPIGLARRRGAHPRLDVAKGGCPAGDLTHGTKPTVGTPNTGEPLPLAFEQVEHRRHRCHLRRRTEQQEEQCDDQLPAQLPGLFPASGPQPAISARR